MKTPITAKIKRLANQRAMITVKVCNGDPHHANRNPQDKNRNAELWETLQIEIEGMLEKEAAKVGLKVLYPAIYPEFQDESGRVYNLKG